MEFKPLNSNRYNIPDLEIEYIAVRMDLRDKCIG